jgi:MFS family permease
MTATETATDLRAARWERRLKPLVIGAAAAVLPLLALSLTHPHGAWEEVETIGHWIVWLLFAVEAGIMLTVSRDRLGWASSHRFELLIVAVSSPLVPLALAAAPALRLLVVAKAFKALKLAKAIKLGKLHKSVKLLRRRLRLGPRAELALAAVGLTLGAGMLVYIVTDETPLANTGNTIALLAVGALVTTCVAHLHRRAKRAAA